MKRYRAVLAAPHARALLLTSLVGRLQIGMAGIALVLFCEEERGSYAVAGAAAAAFAAGTGIGTQVLSRLVDRRGSGLLPLLVAGHVVAIVATFVLVRADAPVVLLVLAPFLAGLCVPPLSSISRSMWPKLLAGRPQLVSAALALESVTIELIFTTGPLIVVLVGALSTPGAALLLGAGLTVAGLAGFLALVPEVERVAVQPGSGRLGALASPGLRTVVLATLPIGMCFGAMEVALPAFADAEGQGDLGGIPVAIWSVGSVLGGLLYGARELHGPPGPRYARLTLVLPAGYLALAAAPGFGGLIVLAFVAGVLIAPTLTAAYQLAGDLAPTGTATEAMAWPVTALVVGIATGNVLAGVLTDATDVRIAMLAAGGCCVVGAAVANVRRATLTAAAAGG